MDDTEKRGPGRPPKAATVAVIVARDFWDDTETRVPAGTIIDVAVDDAMEGIESGAFKRIPKA